MRLDGFKYNFVFYAFYTYYLKKWEYSSDWPQGWATAAFSTLLALIFMGFKLMFIKHDIFLFLRLIDGVFILGFLVVINGVYFLYKKRWKKIVSSFNGFADKEKLVYHCQSIALIISIFAFYFYQVLTFDRAN